MNLNKILIFSIFLIFINLISFAEKKIYSFSYNIEVLDNKTGEYEVKINGYDFFDKQNYDIFCEEKKYLISDKDDLNKIKIEIQPLEVKKYSGIIKNWDYSRENNFKNSVFELKNLSSIRNISFYPIVFYPVIVKSKNEFMICNKFNVIIIDENKKIKSKVDDNFVYENLIKADMFLNKEDLLNSINNINYYKSKQNIEKNDNPFSEGDEWFKLKVNSSGIFKVTFDSLKDKGFPNGVDINEIKLFSGLGIEFSTGINFVKPEFKEVAIKVFDQNNNNIFDSHDYVIFYGNPSNYDYPEYNYYTQKNISYNTNRYDNNSYYFLTYKIGTTNPGKRMGYINYENAQFPNVNSIYKYNRLENDVIYSEKSNYEISWYWKLFDYNEGAKFIEFDYTDSLMDNALLRITTQGYVGNYYPSPSEKRSYKIYLNNNYIDSVAFYPYEYKDIVLNVNKSFFVKGNNILKIEPLSVSNNKFYLDYIEIYSNIYPKTNDLQLQFYSKISNLSSGKGVVSFEGLGNNPFAFDISKQDSVLELEINASKIQIDLSQTKKYWIGDMSKFKSVSEITKLSNNYIRNYSVPKFIIISDRKFMNEASEYRVYRKNEMNYSNDQIALFFMDEVSDQFGWGIKDPGAIRSLVKYFYDKGATNTEKPSYLFLIGNGSFDYKNNSNSSSSGNLIPVAYASGYYPSDDYFVLMSNDEYPDLSVGRLPLETNEKVYHALNNIKNFEQDFGIWKNSFLLAVDDLRNPDSPGSQETYHMRWTEENIVPHFPKYLFLDKLYLELYPLEGNTKPLAKKDFIDYINRGCEFVLFSGHGSNNQLAHENLFNSASDFLKLKNDKKNIFIAFSCDVGHYDNPFNSSMSELLLGNQSRGSVTVFASSRGSFGNSNSILGKFLFYSIYDSNKDFVRFGDAVIMAKNYCASQSNNAQYINFGDPSLKINLAKNLIQINNTISDTLRKKEKVSVIGNANISNLQKVMFVARESGKNYTIPVDNIPYFVPGRRIAAISKDITGTNNFDIDFIIPSSAITGDSAKIEIFAINNNNEASSYYKFFMILGEINPTDNDFSGPVIKLLSNNIEILQGTTLTSTDNLKITFFDNNGIDISGHSGKSVMIKLDNGDWEDISNQILFENDYKNAYYNFKIDLSNGEHNLRIKAYDSYGNFSEKLYSFKVGVDFKEVYPYPNPFNSKTGTKFVFSAQKSGSVKIKIYTITGKLINEIKENISEGHNYVFWDGRDKENDKIANGTYFYIFEYKYYDLFQGKEITEKKRGKIVKID